MRYDKLEKRFLAWNMLRAILHNGWWMVVSLYFVMDARLDASQLLLISVAQGIATIVFEIPAGVLADAVSRKLSLVVSHMMMGIAMVLTGFAQSFIMIAGAQVLWGISWTFSSGADVAWITDELNAPSHIQVVLMRAARYQLIGAGVGMILFSILASISGRQLAIVLAGAAMIVLGLIVALLFPEKGFEPKHVHRMLEAKNIFCEGVRVLMNDRIILLLAVATCVINGAVDIFTRVYPAGLETLGFPTENNGTILFGALSIAGLLIGAFVLLAVEQRIINQRKAKLAMLAACFLGTIGLGVLALVPSLSYALVSILLVCGTAMPISRTITTIWVNQRCESRIRATMHSLFSQAESLGEVLCCVMVAGVAKVSGLSGAMGGACILFVISFLVVACIQVDRKKFISQCVPLPNKK